MSSIFSPLFAPNSHHQSSGPSESVQELFQRRSVLFTDILVGFFSSSFPLPFLSSTFLPLVFPLRALLFSPAVVAFVCFPCFFAAFASLRLLLLLLLSSGRVGPAERDRKGKWKQSLFLLCVG